MTPSTLWPRLLEALDAGDWERALRFAVLIQEMENNANNRQRSGNAYGSLAIRS